MLPLLACLALLSLCGAQRPIEEFSTFNTLTSCQDMAYGLVVAQTRHFPFTITPSADTYNPDDTITVTIQANPSAYLRGFLIQARRADWTLEERYRREPVGFFTVVPGTQLLCEQANGNALTHTTSPEGSQMPKSFLTLTWKAPPTSQGHLRFFVSVVSESSVYWQAESSSVIFDPQAPPMPTTPKPVAQRAISTANCGQFKGCYRNPAACPEPNCTAIVTWRDLGDYVDFELSAYSDGWVAVGFSEDHKMGDDSVTECAYSKDTDAVIVRQSYNEKVGKRNTILEDPTLGLQYGFGYYAQGRLRCFFRRAKRVSGQSAIYDLSARYHILLAWGDTTPQGDKLIHPLEPFKYPFVMPEKISLSDHRDLTSTARYPLVKAHGILMLIAWMMQAGTAIILARYYKKHWPDDDRICGEKKWFASHRGLQLGNLFLTIIAFILIFIHAGGYSQMPNLPARAHPILGIIVTALCVLNPLIAICRCNERSKYRPIFNWFHWLFGSVAFALATPAMLIGLNLPKAHVPAWSTWVMAIFMLFHLIIELLLEIHGCRNGHKQKEQEEKGFLSKDVKPVGYRFRRNVLVVYVIVMVICGVIMVFAIATG